MKYLVLLLSLYQSKAQAPTPSEIIIVLPTPVAAPPVAAPPVAAPPVAAPPVAAPPPATGCTTISGNVVGSPCVFPFTYMGRTYTKCTKCGGFPKPWCSTSTDASGNHVTGSWGDCGANCPVENTSHGYGGGFGHGHGHGFGYGHGYGNPSGGRPGRPGGLFGQWW